MATDPPEVDGQPPTLWDGGPTRADLVIQTARVSSDPVVALDRHRLLWRDSATILVGVVVALIVAQVLVPPSAANPDGSPTPEPSAVEIGSALPEVTLGPGDTFAPIIDPSLGIDATPTPIPVITLGPPPTPGPSPSASPKPSTKPTPRPTPKPTPKPTGTPAPPDVSFNWSPFQPAPLDVVTFDSSGTTGTGPLTFDWSFGDLGTSTLANPTHTYDAPGTYTVRLTVTGPGGTNFAEHPVTVAVLPTP